ncbi:hypothetical protein EYF80_037036 [Liparis tanakae]|uniref:Uncharacterized protein n=1 Tax=Liparis tanakae TaxID=230148 RepID=A0A4Z2GJ37_9TELE|nr:hypothetical protein EYF80_037036 [Liparis tanakae]
MSYGRKWCFFKEEVLTQREKVSSLALQLGLQLLAPCGSLSGAVQLVPQRAHAPQLSLQRPSKALFLSGEKNHQSTGFRLYLFLELLQLLFRGLDLQVRQHHQRILSHLQQVQVIRSHDPISVSL